MEKLKSFFGKKVNVISVIIGWVVLLGVVGCVVTILLLNGYDLAQRTDRLITYETVTEDMALPGGSLLENNRDTGDTNTGTTTTTTPTVTTPVTTTTTSYAASLPEGSVSSATYQSGVLRVQIAFYRGDDTLLANLRAALAAGETIKLYDAEGNLIGESRDVEVDGSFIVAVFYNVNNLLYNTNLTYQGPTVKNGAGEDVTIGGQTMVSVPTTGSFTVAASGAYKVVQTKLQNDMFGVTSKLKTVEVEFNNTTKTDPVNRGRLDGHDLSCFYDEKTDYYYSYGTDAEIGVGISDTTMGIQVRRSKDLVNWEFVGWALDGVYPMGSMYSVTTNGTTTQADAVGKWEPVAGTSTTINQYDYLYNEDTNEYVVKYYYYNLANGTPVLNQMGQVVMNTYIGTAEVDKNGTVIPGTGEYQPASGSQIVYSQAELNALIARYGAVSEEGYTQVYTSSIGEGIYSMQNFMYDRQYADGQHTFWAPDAYYDETSNQYVLYFGVTEVFGSQKAVTYYATSDNPAGGYTIDDNGDGTITMSELQHHMVLNSYAGGGNVIDASIAYTYSQPNYQGEKTFYLSYGSFGGIRLTEMKYDPERGVQMPVGISENGYTTGLPTGDGTLLATLAGGETNQEGSSILTYWNEAEDKYDYFLFVTDGDLYSTYDVRVSRSDTIDGSYVDYNGGVMTTGSKEYYNYQTSAITNIGTGIKLMSSYTWSSSLVGNYETHGSGTWSYAGFKAPGHGTWFLDKNGNFKFIHHTREGGSSSTGTDGTVQYNNHYLVVRDLEFVETSNGTWPVFSPGWYANEGSLQDGSMNEVHNTTYADILGEWEYIVFTETSDRGKLFNDATFTTAGGEIDGDSITGAKVYYGDREGTWSFDAQTKQLTIVLKDCTLVDLDKDSDTYGEYYTDDITLYAKVMVGWDLENTKGTVMFSGIDDTGIAHWGKRTYD